MKKLIVLLIFALFMAGCSTSPYVGAWQAVSADGKTKYDLTLNDDGTLVAKWHDGTQELTKTGTWKEESDGSISLDGVNSRATAKMMQNKLVLETAKRVRHHFTRLHVHKH